MNKTSSIFSPTNLEIHKKSSVDSFNNTRRPLKLNTTIESLDSLSARHYIPDIMRSTLNSMSPVSMKKIQPFNLSYRFEKKNEKTLTRNDYYPDEAFQEIKALPVQKQTVTCNRSGERSDRSENGTRTSILKSRMKLTEDEMSIDEVRKIDDWHINRRKLDIKYGIQSQSSTKSPLLTTNNRVNMQFPKINMEFIDSILKTQTNDKSTEKEKDYIRTPWTNKAESHDNNGTNHLDDRAAQRSLEVKIQDNKKEIVESIIIRKIKKQLDNQTERSPTPENVTQCIDNIARTTFSPFKSLKGMYSKVRINDFYKILSENQSPDHHESFISTAKSSLGYDIPKTPIEYSRIERDLLKELEQIFDTIEKHLKKRGAFLIQIDLISREINFYEEKLAVLKEKQQKVDRRLARSVSIKVKKPKSVKLETNEEASAASEAAELKKMNSELLMKITEMEDKINETKRRKVTNDDQVERIDREVKAYKESKINCKIQLRDVYLRLLHDEDHLLHTTCSSHAWVVRALWNIKQKADSSIFPKYLDSESVTFIFEYAKVQERLLKFCRERNILQMISNHVDFKHDSLGDGSPTIRGRGSIKASEPTSTDPSASPKIKNFSSMLSTVKDRIRDIKGENLIVKDELSSASNTSKIPSWRDKYKAPITTSSSSPGRSKFASNDREHVGTLKDLGYNVRPSIHESEKDVENKRTINQLLKELEDMKKQEKEKLFKKFNSYKFDDDLKQLVLKTFVFLFGTKEGNECCDAFMREQRSYVQNVNTLSPRFSRPSMLQKIVTKEKTDLQSSLVLSGYSENHSRSTTAFRSKI